MVVVRVVVAIVLEVVVVVATIRVVLVTSNIASIIWLHRIQQLLFQLL